MTLCDTLVLYLLCCAEGRVFQTSGLCWMAISCFYADSSSSLIYNCLRFTLNLVNSWRMKPWCVVVGAWDSGQKESSRIVAFLVTKLNEGTGYDGILLLVFQGDVDNS